MTAALASASSAGASPGQRRARARVRERTRELRETQLEVLRRLGQAAELRDERHRRAHRAHRPALRALALAVGLSEAEAELIRHASRCTTSARSASPTASCSSPAASTPTSGRSCAATRRSARSARRLALAAAAGRGDHRADPPRALGRHAATRTGCAARRSRSWRASARSATSSTRCSPSAPTRSAWTVERASRRSPAQRGRHFDPAVADAFLAMVPDLEPELTAAGFSRRPGR